MKFYPAVNLIALILFACGGNQQQGSTSKIDSIKIEPGMYEVQKEETTEPQSAEGHESIIHYQGAAQDETTLKMISIDALDKLCASAGRAMDFKDSLVFARQYQITLSSEDLALVEPLVSAAYKEIDAYKKMVESGEIGLQDFPRLLDIMRIQGAKDSTARVLPPATQSDFFDNNRFFFLGGAPFIFQYLDGDEGKLFSDANGKPERRFGANITENTNFLLKPVLTTVRPAVEIKFGPPLRSYEAGPHDIRGIGSLIHDFKERIPMTFLTAAGPVAGTLISISVKIVPENLGCVSDQHFIQFACYELIDANDILGVYFSMDKKSISCSVTRSSNLWTIDVNNDGIHDIACVSDSFEGISSDTMAENLWFINIKGEWKIIDWGRQLDCT
jgi:hypothetical protein